MEPVPAPPRRAERRARPPRRTPGAERRASLVRGLALDEMMRRAVHPELDHEPLFQTVALAADRIERDRQRAKRRLVRAARKHNRKA